MADLKTKVTELVTGLGMLGFDDVAATLRTRPSQMVSVSPELWLQLEEAYEGGFMKEQFDAAFENGRAFLEARDGLRGRRPEIIEWKGAQSNPGDEALPVDLRIDHVFLISCKYASKLLHNRSPARVFEHSLAPTTSSSSSDWFLHVAPSEYSVLYQRTVEACGLSDMPASPADLSRSERSLLKDNFPAQWSDDVNAAYAELCVKASEVSASLWRHVTRNRGDQERTLWRVLRFGPAPYFVLGTLKQDFLRLRIATPWDWRQRFELRSFEVAAKPGGQPMVGWEAAVKDRHSGAISNVHGHVEIRWSHRRFQGVPEAKVYLDLAHNQVPGYFALR